MSSEDVSNNLWIRYKLIHQLLFDAEEDTRRFQYFVNNQNFIQSFNACRHAIHKCGHNQFSHLNDEEYRALLTVKCCSPTRRKSFIRESETQLEFVPSAFNWKNYDAVCRVKNQGLFGTSWAFSAVAAVESTLAQTHNVLVPFSEQQIIDCCNAAFGRYGGITENVFEYVKMNGIMQEKLYPYKGNQGPSKYDPYNVVYINDHYSLKNSESALESALLTLGPVSVAINASANSFRFYKSGVYFDGRIAPMSQLVDHAMLCVGFEYGVDGMHWILKNSWGTEWGEEGYVRLYRDGRGFAGITQLAAVPILYNFTDFFFSYLFTLKILGGVIQSQQSKENPLCHNYHSSKFNIY